MWSLWAAPQFSGRSRKTGEVPVLTTFWLVVGIGLLLFWFLREDPRGPS